MSTLAFRKAVLQLPLSQDERASLTSDELFVLLLVRRLDRLTDVEQQRLTPADWEYVTSAGLICHVVDAMDATTPKPPGTPWPAASERLPRR